MSLPRKSFSPKPFCKQVSNPLKISLKVSSSSSAISLNASFNSSITTPNSLSTPPVRSSARFSISATRGPMVAFQPSTNVCQIFCSLIRNRRSAASCELRVRFGKDVEQCLPVVGLVLGVEEVVDSERQHDLVADRPEDAVVPVLAAVEHVRPHRAEVGEFLPLLHDGAASLGVITIQSVAHIGPIGELAVDQMI